MHGMHFRRTARHIAAVRELRDRYLEQFNSGVRADGIGVLPGGKYEVSRALPEVCRPHVLALPDAA